MNNTISSSDTYANDRADKHINMMQKQREGWDGKRVTFAGGHSYEIPKAIYSNEIYQVKEQDNEK